MIVGTAGHIDHGKTSLVYALTGVNTDRLPEEKLRGITLDLGFAYVPLPDRGDLGFVDVPGHERLVHTMIAGAASIDLALLVVAADDGVMPQTREHLQILSLLGVTQGVVALTKTDLVNPDRLVEVELDILSWLEGTGLVGAAVFPVSVVTGDGIEALRDHLHRLAREHHRPGGHPRRFRLAVDRSFSIAGAGVIVTGSIVSGSVRVGDNVVVLPSELKARVRGLHRANRVVVSAGEGDRCAINLAGGGVRKDSVGRGDWIVEPGGTSLGSRCDALIDLLRSELRPLRGGTSVLLHHGAGQVAGRIVPLEANALSPGERGFAQLMLDRPLPFRHGDRLVLRDIGGTRTIAGGRVLDPCPPTRSRRSPDRIDVLRALNDGEPVHVLLNAPPYLRSAATVLAVSGLIELPEGLETVAHFIALPERLALLTRTITSVLADFHARQPQSRGMTHSEVRAALAIRLPRDAWDALVTYMTSCGEIVSEGQWLRLQCHRAGLAGDEARLWDAMRALLEKTPHRPPLLREVAAVLKVPDVKLRRACKAFARSGLLVEMAPDRFFLRDAVLAMAENAQGLAADSGPNGFTAADYRDRVTSGRHLAIQVLEYFDRRGITVRRGDRRWGGKRIADVLGS